MGRVAPAVVTRIVAVHNGRRGDTLEARWGRVLGGEAGMDEDLSIEPGPPVVAHHGGKPGCSRSSDQDDTSGAGPELGAMLGQPLQSAELCVEASWTEQGDNDAVD